MSSQESSMVSKQPDTMQTSLTIDTDKTVVESDEEDLPMTWEGRGQQAVRSAYFGRLHGLSDHPTILAHQMRAAEARTKPHLRSDSIPPSLNSLTSASIASPSDATFDFYSPKEAGHYRPSGTARKALRVLRHLQNGVPRNKFNLGADGGVRGCSINPDWEASLPYIMEDWEDRGLPSCGNMPNPSLTSHLPTWSEVRELASQFSPKVSAYWQPFSNPGLSEQSSESSSHIMPCPMPVHWQNSMLSRDFEQVCPHRSPTSVLGPEPKKYVGIAPPSEVSKKVVPYWQRLEAATQSTGGIAGGHSSGDKSSFLLPTVNRPWSPSLVETQWRRFVPYSSSMLSRSRAVSHRLDYHGSTSLGSRCGRAIHGGGQ